MPLLRKLIAVVNGTLTAFRVAARTLGISPKALAAPIGAALTAILAAVGLTPAVIGGWLGIDPVTVAAGITTVAGLIAAWLLPPGLVVAAYPANDAMLGPGVLERLEREDGQG